MKLQKYLDKKKISMNQFAGMIDRNVSTISRICSGEVRPDWTTLDAIYLATGGKVRANDFERSVR